MSPQTETEAALIELLIEADPDSLLEKHADVLTPDQIWRATSEDMAYAIKSGAHRPEVLRFLAEKDTEEFIQENEDHWDDTELLDKMVKAHPDLCLEYIAEKLSPEQTKECVAADLVGAASSNPEALTPEDVAKLVDTNPDTALMCLHSQLDDETFHRLAIAHPSNAWLSDVRRLNIEFLEKYFIPDFGLQCRKFRHYELSDEQIKEIASKHPEFAETTLRKELPKDKRHLIPERKETQPENGRRGWSKTQVFCCGLTAGILLILFITLVHSMLQT